MAGGRSLEPQPLPSPSRASFPGELLTPRSHSPRPRLPGLSPLQADTSSPWPVCAPHPQSFNPGRVLGRRARQQELSALDGGEGRLRPRSMGAGAQAAVYTESTKITEA